MLAKIGLFLCLTGLLSIQTLQLQIKNIPKNNYNKPDQDINAQTNWTALLNITNISKNDSDSLYFVYFNVSTDFKLPGPEGWQNLILNSEHLLNFSVNSNNIHYYNQSRNEWMFENDTVQVNASVGTSISISNSVTSNPIFELYIFNVVNISFPYRTNEEYVHKMYLPKVATNLLDGEFNSSLNLFKNSGGNFVYCKDLKCKSDNNEERLYEKHQLFDNVTVINDILIRPDASAVLNRRRGIQYFSLISSVSVKSHMYIFDEKYN